MNMFNLLEFVALAFTCILITLSSPVLKIPVV